MLHDYRCIVGKDLFRTQGDLWLQSTLLGSISDILGIQGGVLDAKVYQLNKTNKTVIHIHIYIDIVNCCKIKINDVEQLEVWDDSVELIWTSWKNVSRYVWRSQAVGGCKHVQTTECLCFGKKETCTTKWRMGNLPTNPNSKTSQIHLKKHNHNHPRKEKTWEIHENNPHRINIYVYICKKHKHPKQKYENTNQQNHPKHPKKYSKNSFTKLQYPNN